MNSVERSKAAEAFSYLSAVRDAQERYQAREGTCAADGHVLDIQFATPTYFTTATPVAGGTGNLETSWSMTLTRTGAAAGYDGYTVIFTAGRLRRHEQHHRRLPADQPDGHRPECWLCRLRWLGWLGRLG